MVKFLKGKKAYITAALLAIIALVDFLAAGDFSFAAITTLFETQAVAGAIAAIRAGIAKS